MSIAANKDHQFLNHLEKLERSKLEAEQEQILLLKVQRALQDELIIMESKRNEAAKSGAKHMSEQNRVLSLQFEQRILRHDLESRFSNLLWEEAHLLQQNERFEKNALAEDILREIEETNQRLREGASCFQAQLALPAVPSVFSSQERFELDRARKKLEQLHRDWEESKVRLEAVQRNETSLKQKVNREEERKNENDFQ